MRRARAARPGRSDIPLEVRRSGTSEAAFSFIGNSPSFFKDLHEHLPCKFAGLRVLVRGMVGHKQHSSIGRWVFLPVLKDVSFSGFEPTESL